MNGVRVAVHRSSSLSERRKLLSSRRYRLVPVVSKIAPDGSRHRVFAPRARRRDHRDHHVGEWRFCRLRHFPSLPSQSLTATSWRPASSRLATTLDPINPHPRSPKTFDGPRRPPLPTRSGRRTEPQGGRGWCGGRSCFRRRWADARLAPGSRLEDVDDGLYSSMIDLESPMVRVVRKNDEHRVDARFCSPVGVDQRLSALPQRRGRC